MRGVRPFTEKEVAAMARSFGGRWALRNKTMFALGCETGFRIHEILSLKIGDVVTSQGRIASTVALSGRKMKESRGRSWPTSRTLKKSLRAYVNDLCELGYGREAKRPLFITDCLRSVQPSSAWESVRRAADVAGLEGRIGTHSMRKTFAWRVYNEASRQFRARKSDIDPMRAVQLALGHKSIETTISYMGFLDKDFAKIVKVLALR